MPEPLNALASLGDGTWASPPPNTLLGQPPPAPVPQMDPNDMTGHYNTPLSPQEEAAYQAWGQQQAAQGGRNPAADTYDYDMRGFWKNGGAFAANGHAGDAFKKPNHPTFSDQSLYHGVDGHQGGAWGGGQNGQPWTFTPGASNLKAFDPADLQRYFQDVEPGNRLILPSPGLVGPPPNALLGAAPAGSPASLRSGIVASMQQNDPNADRGGANYLDVIAGILNSPTADFSARGVAGQLMNQLVGQEPMLAHQNQDIDMRRQPIEGAEGTLPGFRIPVPNLDTGKAYGPFYDFGPRITSRGVAQDIPPGTPLVAKSRSGTRL